MRSVEQDEIKERLTMLEATQSHLIQQARASHERALTERGRARGVRVLMALIVIDILIQLWRI